MVDGPRGSLRSNAAASADALERLSRDIAASERAVESLRAVAQAHDVFLEFDRDSAAGRYSKCAGYLMKMEEILRARWAFGLLWWLCECVDVCRLIYFVLEMRPVFVCVFVYLCVSASAHVLVECGVCHLCVCVLLCDTSLCLRFSSFFYGVAV
jgi:hypothetical protein